MCLLYVTRIRVYIKVFGVVHINNIMISSQMQLTKVPVSIYFK